MIPTPFRGADIYVDEAGLLDTPKALALVRLAERVDARVIFQGDTEQMAAVGRGQPIKLLQDELGLGMHVPRASISRRQLSVADKQLAADLSSGNDGEVCRGCPERCSTGA
jgi:ATP-dependent exoDNAse (exonuclease V) alpha subunit